MRVREYSGGYVIVQATGDKGLNPCRGRRVEKWAGTAQICPGSNRQRLVTTWTGREESGKRRP